MKNGIILDPTVIGFDLFSSPFYLIAHADFQYHTDVETVLTKNGVNKNIYRILTVLRECKTSSISTLAQHALIKRNTVSRLVERMQEMNLVTTNLLAEDNRVTMVTLSPDGYTLLNRLTPVVARQIARAMSGLDQQEIEQFVMILRRIIKNLHKLSIE